MVTAEPPFIHISKLQGVVLLELGVEVIGHYYWNTFSHFGTILAYDEQTDGQTVRQGHSIMPRQTAGM